MRDVKLSPDVVTYNTFGLNGVLRNGLVVLMHLSCLKRWRPVADGRQWLAGCRIDKRLLWFNSSLP
ncbi:hypothetical protein Scep_016614 [Stephania cephalantha]|uniref:Uncharacterized protein n=1 Tax=Stephania cephalantha TaxID=152367 RepID=A0AAP0IN19_9MAGN